MMTKSFWIKFKRFNTDVQTFISDSAGWEPRVLYALIVFIPLAFDPRLIDVCHLPKITLIRLATLLLAALIATKFLRQKKISVPFSPLVHPVTALLIAEILSWCFSTNPAGSFWGLRMYDFEGVLQTLTFVTLAACVSCLRPPLKTVMDAYVCGTGVMCVYGWIQWAGWDPVYWNFDTSRVFASFGNPNFFGAYLAVSLPVILSFGMSRTGFRARAVATFLMFAVSGLLYLTYTRAAWIAAGVGCLALFGLVGRSVLKKDRVWLTALGGILVASFVAISQTAVLRQRAEVAGSGSIYQRAQLLFSGQDPSVESRRLLWEIALRMWRDHPFLGTGPDTFAYNFRRYLTREYADVTNRIGNAGYAHNEYVNTLATKGLLGLGVYLWFLAVLLVCARRFVKRQGVGAAGVVGGLIALLTNNVFSFSTVTGAFYLWLVVGLVNADFTRKSWPLFALSNSRRDFGETAWRSSIWAAAVSGIFFAFFPYEADRIYTQGVRLMNKEDWLGAGKRMRKALRLSPFSFQFQESLAKCYAQYSRGVEDKAKKENALRLAERHYKEFLEAYPQNALGYNGLGVVYLYWGSVLDRSKLPLAKESFSKAVEVDPFFLEASMNLGTYYQFIGETEQAVAHYQNLAGSEPDAAMVHLNLGRLYELQGKRTEALGAYQRAVELDTNNPQAQEALVSLWNR